MTATENDSTPVESEQTMSMRVIAAVADATDTDPIHLPQLYEEIDPEALDSLFTYDETTTHPLGAVTFQFANCIVTIESDGSIEVSGGQTDSADGATEAGQSSSGALLD